MWNEFMQKALAGRPAESFRVAEEIDREGTKPIIKGLWRGGVQYVVDKISGKLATEYTPKELREARVVQNVHSTLHWVDKDNPLGPIPERPEDDPQYPYWEYPVTLYKAAHNLSDETEAVIPKESDDVHRPDYAPVLQIVSPIANTAFGQTQKITVSVASSSRYPITKMEFMVNGTLLGTSTRAPFAFTFLPQDAPILGEENTLEVVAYDAVLNRGSATISFSIR
jgi:hypothetical protein